jgi:cell division protein FtsI (penicillin-binding protein 3)
MLIKHDDLSRWAAIQHTKGQQILVRRGVIYDRKGRELAVNLERSSLYADPSMIESPEKVAYILGRVIKRKVPTLIKKLRSRKHFVWIAKKVSPEQAAEIKRLKIKGLDLLPDTKRFYPKGIIASHVLGFVNIDNRGLEGIEKRYEKFLVADGGRIYLPRDARGNILYTGLEYESVGNNVVLTIDEGLQNILESEIEKAVRRWKPLAVSAIIMDPRNGEILALSNRPTFDPNRPGRYSPSARRNRAVTDLYEPGSTFKLLMAAAALEERVATLDTRIDCSEGMIVVGGKRIRDHHRNGVLTLKEVIQKSSNVGAVKMALKLGPELLYKYVKRFGFGNKTGVDLTGESGGIVKPPDRWSGSTIGAMAIGYEVMVTPLQILRAYAAVANGGYLVKPHIVSKIFSVNGRILSQVDGPERKRIISERTAALLREALVSVTKKGGTARKASVDGNTVAGKTGTAYIFDPETGKYSRKDFVSSFVGFVPAKDPLFSIVVVIWKPKGRHYGGEVAAPVFRNIAEKALAYRYILREDSKKEHILVVYRENRARI